MFIVKLFSASFLQQLADEGWKSINSKREIIPEGSVSSSASNLN